MATVDRSNELSLAETLTMLAEAIATLKAPPIPLERQLWTVKDIADYMKVKSESTVYTNAIAKPSFPKPVKIAGSRWVAGEVIKWAEKQRG